MNFSQSASLVKTTFVGLFASVTLGLEAIQPAGAVNRVCSALDATSIISSILPSPSCGAINPGDTFGISYTGPLNIADAYTLEVANINGAFANSHAFRNVQFLVSGATTINGVTTPFTNQAITIWPSNSANNPGGTPYISQGESGYVTNDSTALFGGSPVSTNASFSLTSPVSPATPLGTAGLILTEPLLLTSANVSSFTGFTIKGQFFSGAGPFAAGIGIYTGGFTPGLAPNQILGNAYNLPVPAPLPLLGIGAALGWSRPLRRRISASKA